MYYVYVTSGPSLLIESTDSMIYLLWNVFGHDGVEAVEEVGFGHAQ